MERRDVTEFRFDAMHDRGDGGEHMSDERKSDEPRWHPVAIKAAPKLGSIYWCDFHPPEHVHLPEMWKQRPVVVVTHRSTVVKGPVLVVPTSTDPQEANPWAFPMPDYIRQAMGGRASWVICNHLVTMSTSRLRQVGGAVPRLQKTDINSVLDLIHDGLPKALP